MTSLRAGWVPVTQWWWLSRVWEPGSEGAGRRTKTGCWRNTPGQGEGTSRDTRPTPTPPSPGPGHRRESWVLGPCPSFSEQRVTFVVQSLSRVRLFVTPWTAARQASLYFTKFVWWIWWRFTGALWPDRDLTSRTKDVTPRSLQQLTTPIHHLS